MCGDKGAYLADFRFLVRASPCSSFPVRWGSDFVSWRLARKRIFGDSARLLDIWPSYSKSPILTHFSWSPLITAALAANAHVIHPALSSLTPSSFSPYSKPSALSGLLALHIRRGDFIDHCLHLANWTSRFSAFNELPGLPDRFIPPPWSDAQVPEEQARYRARCFPEIGQIVSRVREVRASLKSATRLTRIYVLTNGRPEWLQELKDALQEDAVRERLDPWLHISTSRDLRLTREQRHNGQAIDMAVAQRAEVFLGNGVSFAPTSFFFFFLFFPGELIPRGTLSVFEFDVECRHVARGARFPVGQFSFLVTRESIGRNVRGPSPALFYTRCESHSFVLCPS